MHILLVKKLSILSEIGCGMKRWSAGITRVTADFLKTVYSLPHRIQLLKNGQSELRKRRAGDLLEMYLRGNML